MNKTKTLLILCTFYGLILKGQSHYISPVINYAFGTNLQYYGTYNDATKVFDDSSNTDFSYTCSGFSLGGGMSYGALYGYTLNKNISFEVVLGYFKGKKHDVKSFSSLELAQSSVYNVRLNYTYGFRYSSLSLAPAIKFSGNREMFDPYISFGPYLSYGTLKEQQDITIYNNLPGYIPIERYEFTYLYSPRVLMGIREAIGIDISRNKFLNIFVEIQNTQLNCKPQYKKCTAKLYQGEDQTSSLTNRERTVYFVDSYDESELNSNDPDKHLRVKFLMSSIAINAGLKYYF